MHQRHRTHLCLILAMPCLLFAPHCAHTPTTLFPKSAQYRQRALAVFLHGRGGSRFDLQSNGLLDTLRASDLSLDVKGIRMPFRYYFDRSLHRRVEDDVMKPAVDSGYQRIWFFGNSMGGVGSLLYASKHPAPKIEAVLLIGPYLGDDSIVNEVSRAGGVRGWTPRDSSSDNFQRDTWVYLRACVLDSTGSLPRIYLIAGTSDRFHAAQQLLADALPPDRVYWAPGGHDWDAWRAAFGAFVRNARDQRLFDAMPELSPASQRN